MFKLHILGWKMNYILGSNKDTAKILQNLNAFYFFVTDLIKPIMYNANNYPVF